MTDPDSMPSGEANAPDETVRDPEAQATDSAQAAPWLDQAGRERPRFIRSFPEDEALTSLVQAFEAGNYALVREQAPKLAAATSNPEVKRAALELKARIEPDPLVKLLFLLAVLLFLFLTVWSYVAEH